MGVTKVLGELAVSCEAFPLEDWSDQMSDEKSLLCFPNGADLDLQKRNIQCKRGFSNAGFEGQEHHNTTMAVDSLELEANPQWDLGPMKIRKSI